jgi:hypothetical protein
MEFFLEYVYSDCQKFITTKRAQNICVLLFDGVVEMTADHLVMSLSSVNSCIHCIDALTFDHSRTVMSFIV